jgi:CRP-like cAMP-binding protein
MQNRLLAKMAHEKLDALLLNYERVSLPQGKPVIVPDEPIHDVYFPLDCLLSMVTLLEDGTIVESACIGREGMSGIPVLLDADQTTMETVVQIPGNAIRISMSVVKEAYERNRAVRSILNRYIHAVVIVGSRSAACNAMHTIEQRLCRWLLMSSEGIGSDEVALTHEYLAAMLGVRRAGVTIAAGTLQSARLIETGRGRIRIRDREALERAACECYGRTKEEYERVFATGTKDGSSQ